MVSNLAEDCSKLFKLNIDDDLIPVRQSVDEMLTRLEEFETLIAILQRGPRSLSTEAYGKMIECKPELDVLNARIDCLHVFMTRVSGDMAVLERQVDLAETELGIPDTTIKGLLKPFLSKISKDSNASAAETESVLEYKRPELFKTSDYFP